MPKSSTFNFAEENAGLIEVAGEVLPFHSSSVHIHGGMVEILMDELGALELRIRNSNEACTGHNSGLNSEYAPEEGVLILKTDSPISMGSLRLHSWAIDSEIFIEEGKIKVSINTDLNPASSYYGAADNVNHMIESNWPISSLTIKPGVLPHYENTDELRFIICLDSEHTIFGSTHDQIDLAGLAPEFPLAYLNA